MQSNLVIELIMFGQISRSIFSSFAAVAVVVKTLAFTVRFYRILLKKEKASQINTKPDLWPPSVATSSFKVTRESKSQSSQPTQDSYSSSKTKCLKISLVEFESAQWIISKERKMT